MSNPFQIFERQIAEEKSMIKELKALLARAADKIEKVTWSLDFVHKSVWEAHEIPDLIAELRKAAQ